MKLLKNVCSTAFEAKNRYVFFSSGVSSAATTYFFKDDIAVLCALLLSNFLLSDLRTLDQSIRINQSDALKSYRFTEPFRMV
jgi:hypothetical protein